MPPIHSLHCVSLVMEWHLKAIKRVHPLLIRLWLSLPNNHWLDSTKTIEWRALVVSWHDTSHHRHSILARPCLEKSWFWHRHSLINRDNALNGLLKCLILLPHEPEGYRWFLIGNWIIPTPIHLPICHRAAYRLLKQACQYCQQ